MPDTNVIDFPSQPIPRRPPALGTGGYGLSGTQGPIPTATKMARPIIRGSAALAPIEIDKLYPADKNSASDLIAALGLLAAAIRLLAKARTASPQDTVAA